MLNVDTHVLLCAVVGALRPRETRLLRTQLWSISAIVLWEIAKLAQLGRIAVDLDDSEVVRVLSRLHIWPLTREVARARLQRSAIPSVVASGRPLCSRRAGARDKLKIEISRPHKFADAARGRASAFTVSGHSARMALAA